MSTLYEKRGRRYVPVREEFHPDHLPAGTYLLKIQPGTTSITRIVQEDHAGFLAAAKVAHDAMARAISEATRPHPAREITRPKLKRAWKAYQEIAGDDILILQFWSSYDIAQAGIEAVEQEYERQRAAAPRGDSH